MTLSPKQKAAKAIDVSNYADLTARRVRAEERALEADADRSEE